MNLAKAVKFIKANGTVLDKYRLDFLLNKKKDDRIPLRHLRSLQDKDGGFPYNDKKDGPSCVNSVGNKLALMIELGLGRSDPCKRTVEYLFKIKEKNGSWTENIALKQHDPPFWDLPSDPKTTMWLTANIASLLIQLGYRDSPAVKRATEFLFGNRDKEGKFAGFLHSTWISIGVFGQLEGRESDIVRKATKVIEENIDKLGSGDYAWCLECLYVAGIPKEEPLAKKCIEKLVSRQEENGVWKSEDGEEFTVSTTISVLSALKKYGAW
jgi:hypothetical protein